MDEGSSLNVDIYGMDGIVEGGTMPHYLYLVAGFLIGYSFQSPSRYINDTA